MRRIGQSWTDDREAVLLSGIKRGLTVTQIAGELDTSRSAVSGQIHRMKLANDPRLAASGYSAMSRRKVHIGDFRRQQTRDRMDDLAELLSQEVPMKEAAGLLKITESKAWRTFDRIRASLGRQAR